MSRNLVKSLIETLQKTELLGLPTENRFIGRNHCNAVATRHVPSQCAYEVFVPLKIFIMADVQWQNSELKQVTFLTARTSTGSKVDVFHQSQPLTQSSDVTHAVRVVKNVACLSPLMPLVSTLA
jgi:hypothetical protein